MMTWLTRFRERAACTCYDCWPFPDITDPACRRHGAGDQTPPPPHKLRINPAPLGGQLRFDLDVVEAWLRDAPQPEEAA